MKLDRYIFLFAFVVFFATVFAQGEVSAFDYSFRLKEVHFSGGEGSNYITINRDASELVGYDIDGRPVFLKKPFLAPQFNSSSSERFPVGYVSGSKPRVKAVFETDCTNGVYIRGTGPSVNDWGYGLRYNFIKKLITPSSGQLVYDFQSSTNSFPHLDIKCYDNFYIKWEVSLDGNNWKYIGSSSNRLFVTRTTPLDGLETFHTVIDWSCHKAGGEEEPSEIMDEIYEDFRPGLGQSFPGVRRASDGHVLTYYVDVPSASPSTPGGFVCGSDITGMLYYGDGRCGAWASLLRAMLRIQGLSGIGSGDPLSENVTLLRPLGDPNPAQGYGSTIVSDTDMLVFKTAFEAEFDRSFFSGYDWFDGSYIFLVKRWPDVNEGQFIELLEAPYSNDNREIAQSAPGGEGISGQGNIDEPRSIFRNHGIVKFDGKRFDPSYGKLHTSTLADYESTSFDAVKAIFFYRGVDDINVNSKFYCYILQVGNETGIDFFEF